MYKIGVSTNGNQPLTDETFRAMAENQIGAIEICLAPEKYKELDYKKIALLSKQYGITLWSYHLPFDPFSELDVSSPDPLIRNHTITYFSELMKKGADIGIATFVVHPSIEPIEDAEREDRLQRAMDTLDRLAETADQCGARIAVEDLPRTCLGHTADDVVQLISANDKLRVCFDTNHLLLDDPYAFMDTLKDRIVTLHISDYDFIDERHWMPGEGKLDWVRIVDGLEKINYQGVWMYEVPLKSGKTVMRSRDLTYRDFYENAMAVLNRKKPPVL